MLPGEVLSAWTSSRRPKAWRTTDPAAIPGTQFFEFDDVPMVTFQRVFFGKAGTDGRGVLESLTMTVEEANTFNIAPTGPGSTNVPGADRPPRPVPVKQLSSVQALVRRDGHPLFEVRNLDVASPMEAAGGWTAEKIEAVYQAALETLSRQR
jgi:hypothetical protein